MFAGINMQEIANVTETFAQLGKFFTQKEIAHHLGYSVRQISRWKSGESRIPGVAVFAMKQMLQTHVHSDADSDFTFIDLFAGIGGMRIGFEEHGGKCVFTSEWDNHAQKTYHANFHDGHAIAGDITKIDVADIPDHDVLLAGFPCQPFSIAGVSKKNAIGQPHGFECKTQGTLFFDVARIIAAKQPHAFLLENVKNLVSHDRGNTFKVIRDVLENELGYQITWKVINGKHFVPQSRERILIVGFREKTGFDWDAIPFPDLADPSNVLARILHREDGTEKDVDEGRFLSTENKVLDKYTLTDNLWAYLQAYAQKHKAKGNGFGCSVVTSDDTARTLSARYYKDGSEILISRGQSKNPRRLTPRECARLMGFPDSFLIPVSDTRAYQQFGNSVVVPLVKHVARLMKPCIMDLKDRSENGVWQGALFSV